MPAPQTPSSRPQPGAGRPHTAMSMLQQRAGSARGPNVFADPSASFKRPKMVGDGYEAPYLLPGPSNRILLSLKSGLPNQIDWALSRLVLLTANHRDQAARDFTFDSVPGLADALLSYVRRIHAALTGEHQSKWATSYFEQPPDAHDIGIGAPGDAGHQGTSTRQQTSVSNTLPATRPHDLAIAKLSSSTTSSASFFNPSHDPAHAVLMRRALEAALAIRNLTTHSSNARSLASIKGIYALIRDILQLPSTAIQISAHAQQSETDSEPAHEDGWLEIEGIAELRLYFLDILETLAARITLTRRAATGTSVPSAPATVNGHDTASSTLKSTKEDVVAPADHIFATLLSLALHSNDRAFIIGSLRCLTTMAANERNEAGFVEVTLPNGHQSPGLLQRCVELLPLTQDTDLLEAALDLLYQLVCIGNNAIKVATVLNLEPLRANSPVSRLAVERNGSTDSHSARATAKTAALVRLLSRNLQLGRSMWERSMPLKVPQQWLASIPSRQVEAMRRQRELQFRIANETPQERSKRKRLTPQERQSLAGLQEPERGIAWMKLLFQRNPEKEVTQMEFWTAYKEEFQGDGIALQPAAELIRAVGIVFPQAAAMVVPKQDGQPQRFVIRGIDVKDRDIDQLEPYRCHWSTCSSPATTTLEAQRGHAKLHAQYAPDGRCRWKRCDFDANNGGTASEEEQKRVLVAHVLTHLKSADASASGGAKHEARSKVVVDDDLRVVSGATHTGEAAELITAKADNGARVLRGKRDPDGVEIKFTMDKPAAGQNGVHANGVSNGHLAPSNATPSSGTLDNPGTYVFDVTRTPSSGNDDNLSPQGPAFTSILILRMLTRRAASLLQKAGSKRSNQSEDDEDAAAIRGQGDEKFGLPLPANFGSSDRFKQGEAEDGNAQDGIDAGGSLLGTEEEDYETTETWAVDAATRLLDAVEGVEEDLLHHSSQNDILSSYINETLLELRRRPTASGGEASDSQVDPKVLRDKASLL
ncbi:hypothetical protein NDA16_002436 [Ustilago loliicola]|nr:hypothetical protein NDA16_002436 [Ustilago loliicola]